MSDSRRCSKTREGTTLDPADLLVLDCEWLAPHFHLYEPDHERGVGISALVEGLADEDRLQPKLLLQLPAYGFEVRLIVLDFSARELPESSVTLVGGAPSQENPPVPPYDCGYHRNLVHDLVHPARGVRVDDSLLSMTFRYAF